MPTRLTPAQRWVLGLVGLLVLVASPWLWWVDPNLLWVAGAVVAAWAVWLVVRYLDWARSLRQR